MGFLSRLFGSGKDQSPPRIVTHEAFDGAIRVIESPAGWSPEWEASEEQREGDGFNVIGLKYVLPLAPRRLILRAKIYTLSEPPPDSRNTDFREVLGPL